MNSIVRGWLAGLSLTFIWSLIIWRLAKLSDYVLNVGYSNLFYILVFVGILIFFIWGIFYKKIKTKLKLKIADLIVTVLVGVYLITLCSIADSYKFSALSALSLRFVCHLFVSIILVVALWLGNFLAGLIIYHDTLNN